MKLNFPSHSLSCALLSCALLTSAQALAQQVIFPQQQQAGVAVAVKNGDDYTLQNDLLKATFRKQGNSIFFGGCPELNLAPGSELFILRLSNGQTTVKASDMTLVGDIRQIDYAADPTKVKGSEKLAGKALEAEFTRGNLRVIWRAVLRDGSHYLRTELQLKAEGDNVKFFSITPMTYSVDVAAAGSAPKVVGNTRGAVLLSDKMFAGLETPTGINSVGSSNSVDNFTYNRWTPELFSWMPGEETPQGILNLGYAVDQIAAAKGYVSFKTQGAQTLTFQYKSGNHKLNIVGVDVVKLDGTIVSSDYHFGSTGGASSNNTYRINIPETGVYLLRYFVETRTESIASSGNIAFSGRVAQPIVVFDLAPETPVQAYLQPAPAWQAPQTRALSNSTVSDGDVISDNWTPANWTQLAQVPRRVNELGWYAPNVFAIEQPITLTSKGRLTAEFLYKSGANRLDLCGVDLLDGDGQEVVSDYHNGFTGSASDKNVYSFQVPYAGNFRLRYFATNKNEALTSSGDISLQFENPDTIHLPAARTTEITGVWSRNTTLQKGKTWDVSAVVGHIAPGQPRRSFLAYNERERAVPWRPMPIYVSWYELNIDRNNDPNYTGNMHDYQCNNVVEQWKKNLYEPYGEFINSYVWDDGWDFYGPWTFNQNFPNGFNRVDELAKEMGSGIGAWLGPVGGYGQSGNYRRAYWANQGGMQLSNPLYYKAFTDAIVDLCNGRGYDFRFFKFDGISAQFSSVGPDPGTVGEENAEGIISAEKMVRRDIKPDIFFNTTVGTWASPFWFGITDAVWRQEKDYGEAGNQGSDRERWITYRDHLVYQNFVQNSPICPINNLMTHGFILSKFGDVSKDMSYDAIVREMRCAFACGSSMVELYNDYALMNSLYGGRLWGDLAECLRWQRKNADVLPDAHWVGGNPWDGSRANVYGWASWNGTKATLALRNPAASAQTFKTTLRAALEIPAYVTGEMVFDKSFATQAALNGFAEGEPINIDTPLMLRLPASSVFVFDGRNSDIPAVETTGIEFTLGNIEVEATKSKALIWNVLPADATNQTVTWSTSDATVATVKNGIVTAKKVGTATITVTTANGHTATITINVTPLQVEPYAISFDKDDNPKNSGRFLRSLSMKNAQGETKTLTLNANHKPYQEFLTEPIEVNQGQTLTLIPDWNGAWMHGYVYLDANRNQQFDVTSANSSELVAFNYFEGQKKGHSGLSAEGNNNPGVNNIPAFKAPQELGVYRLRFKVDWDNISPAGSTKAGDDILKNGGSITDFLIKVVDPNGLSSVSYADSSDAYHDLSGRRLDQPSEHGVFIRNGKKEIK